MADIIPIGSLGGGLESGGSIAELVHNDQGQVVEFRVQNLSTDKGIEAELFKQIPNPNGDGSYIDDPKTLSWKATAGRASDGMTEDVIALPQDKTGIVLTPATKPGKFNGYRVTFGDW